MLKANGLHHTGLCAGDGGTSRHVIGLFRRWEAVTNIPHLRMSSGSASSLSHQQHDEGCPDADGASLPSRPSPSTGTTPTPERAWPPPSSDSSSPSPSTAAHPPAPWGLPILGKCASMCSLACSTICQTFAQAGIEQAGIRAPIPVWWDSSCSSRNEVKDRWCHPLSFIRTPWLDV